MNTKHNSKIVSTTPYYYNLDWKDRVWQIKFYLQLKSRLQASDTQFLITLHVSSYLSLYILVTDSVITIKQQQESWSSWQNSGRIEKDDSKRQFVKKFQED